MFKKNNRSLANQVGLLWACVYKVLKTYTERQKNWLAILHEDLCIDPETIFKNVFEWAELDFSKRIKRRIIRNTMSGNPVKAPRNELYYIKRDSMKLIDYWKETVSIDERKILRSITEPISSFYYNDNSWK